MLLNPSKSLVLTLFCTWRPLILSPTTVLGIKILSTTCMIQHKSNRVIHYIYIYMQTIKIWSTSWGSRRRFCTVIPVNVISMHTRRHLVHVSDEGSLDLNSPAFLILDYSRFNPFKNRVELLRHGLFSDVVLNSAFAQVFICRLKQLIGDII